MAMIQPSKKGPSFKKKKKRKNGESIGIHKETEYVIQPHCGRKKKKKTNETHN